MLKTPNYIYGPTDIQVPANLNFGDYILNKLWLNRDKVALINGATNGRITYAQILQQSMNFAISLTHMGIGKGETIGLFSENRQEYMPAVLGAVCAGAVLTTVSTGYVKGELIHVLNISKPAYIICSPKIYKAHADTLKTFTFLKKIILFGEERLPETIMFNDLTLESNNGIRNVKYEDFHSVDVKGQIDTIFILYSSGTTGLPKGVMLTHLNVMTACSMPATYDTKEIYLFISPWYHVMGLIGCLAGLSLGRTGVYLPKFDMDLYLRAIEKYKIVQLTVVPPVLVGVCKYPSKHNLSSVRAIYSGAAPLHKDTIEAAFKKFPNLEGVLQGYGATEVTLGVIRFIAKDIRTDRIGSVGRICSNTIIKVVDIETRQPVGPNTSGEICCKGALLMKGYVGQDANDDFDDEGFYKTGDIGYYEDDGYFYIVDRLKELIKYKGYQVPPAEVEAVLLMHPGIKEAAVIGIEDKLAGELPLAFVVTQPGVQLSEGEVKQFVAERLSNPKHLRGGVRFIDQIPKSASGKLLRKDLRKMVTSVKSRL